MAEWTKAAGCKPVSVYSRWFESNFFHYILKKNFYLMINKKISLYLKYWDDTSLRHPIFVEIKSKKSLSSFFICKYVDIYQLLYLQPLAIAYYIWISNRNLLIKNIYNLRFKFFLNKFRVSLENKIFNHNYFSLSPGILIKGFDYKKSLKNSYTLKLLLIKFLRKLLIVLNIKKLSLIVQGNPLNLIQFLRVLFKPLQHFFKNPLTTKFYDEITSKPFNFNLYNLVFKKVFLYKPLKLRKIGRIKRKIRRKLVFKNRLMD